uniref:Uncharacterized protein n=1 Tax=Mola mola TaxID=94237 RepID=A0A3Q3WMD8_MOLML
MSAAMSLFSSPVYSRYWQHYQQAMAWYQRHRRAYRRALEAAYSPACSPGYRQEQRSSSCRRYADWQAEESSSDSEIECDVSNMEISEELRQYFAQTEKHREELKKQQQMEAEQQGNYVPADQDLRAVSWLSSSAAPPSERPGARRGAEMKKLYGEDAAKMQAMEAAMQLSFDRNCDLKQPKYWPVIPLKL